MGTRRDFLFQAAVIGAGAAALPQSLYGMDRRVAPSDRIRVGLIGCNSMGWSDLNTFLNNPEVECVAICDVDDQPLNRRMDDVDFFMKKFCFMKLFCYY